MPLPAQGDDLAVHTEIDLQRRMKAHDHAEHRVARLQNEIGPEKCLIQREKGFEKREKKIRNVPEKLVAPLRLLKNSSPALF